MAASVAAGTAACWMEAAGRGSCSHFQLSENLCELRFSVWVLKRRKCLFFLERKPKRCAHTAAADNKKRRSAFSCTFYWPRLCLLLRAAAKGEASLQRWVHAQIPRGLYPVKMFTQNSGQTLWRVSFSFTVFLWPDAFHILSSCNSVKSNLRRRDPLK